MDQFVVDMLRDSAVRARAQAQAQAQAGAPRVGQAEIEAAWGIISTAISGDPTRIVDATTRVLGHWRRGDLTEDELPVARIFAATWFAYATDDRPWLKEISAKARTLLEEHAGELRHRRAPRATGPCLSMIVGRGGDVMTDRDDVLRELRAYTARVLREDWPIDDWSDAANDWIGVRVAASISALGFAIDGVTVDDPQFDPERRAAYRDGVAAARKHGRNGHETRSREDIAEDVVRAVLRVALRAAGRSAADAQAKTKNVFANVNKLKKRHKR